MLLIITAFIYFELYKPKEPQYDPNTTTGNNTGTTLLVVQCCVFTACPQYY